MAKPANVNTDGGAYIGGNVSVGGEFVGRDKIVEGDKVQGDKIQGNVTIGTVGNNARNVAIGSNITQIVTENASQSTGEAQQQIKAALANLGQAVSTIADQRLAMRAEVHLETVQQELTKTTAAVNGGALTNALDWLQKNTPAVAPALNALLALPAVRQLLTQSDQQTGAWWRRWFA